MYFMPCFHPLQAYFSIRPDGKKEIEFSNVLGRMFVEGVKLPSDSVSIPCGRCMGCRLERARQWALRCVHESKMYDDNCFVTLTFDDDHLAKMCPGGSLVKSHCQDFLKRLRKKFSDRKIRVFYCGEYGTELSRPHYHFCLFNLDFHDRVKYKKVNGFWYYNSDILSSIWPFGHSVVCDFSFDTAGYVARYCTKKISGVDADSHYQGRLPEFAQMSLKPGLGRAWLDKYGKSDVFPHDSCVSRGVICKPPRYYDKALELYDPVFFAETRARRVAKAALKIDDSSFRRLADREKVMQSRVRLLIRNLEK